MSSSLFAAMALISRFCPSVSFLISLPFVELRCASRNDPNNFVVLLFIECVHDEQNRTNPYGSKRDPALFRLKGHITLSESVRVVKNQTAVQS